MKYLLVLLVLVLAPEAHAAGGGRWTSWARRPWRPDDVPGSALAVRYDASSLAATSALTTLSDLSRNARDASGGVGVGATKPAVVTASQNGQSVVRATAASSQNLGMSVPLTAAFSMVWCGTASSAASSYMVADSVNSDGIISRFTATALEWFGDATERATFAAAPSGFHVWQVDHTDAGSYVLWQDGTQVATGASHRVSSGVSLVKVFSTAAATPAGYASVDLGEFMVFSSVLSATERARIQAAYLKPKWGTP